MSGSFFFFFFSLICMLQHRICFKHVVVGVKHVYSTLVSHEECSLCDVKS
jgi:hypothetical protein